MCLGIFDGSQNLKENVMSEKNLDEEFFPKKKESYEGSISMTEEGILLDFPNIEVKVSIPHEIFSQLVDWYIDGGEEDLKW